MSRFQDAYDIQQGACNPSGIARALVKACDEARDEITASGVGRISDDPAVRLIVHQLAYICKVGDCYADAYFAEGWKKDYDFVFKKCEEEKAAKLSEGS